MPLKISCVVFLLMVSLGSKAQQIAIDRGLKVGSLWCFPSVSDSLTYYYLPSSAKLAMDEKGLPKFSLLRYVSNKKSDSESSLSEADGGAVLHFLVKYDTPDESIRKANVLLKKTVGDNVILKAPIIFKKARYTLVSSILNDEKYKVLSTGDAPVLENSTMAFSFELKPKDSKILLESFRTGTSDVSIVFDFTFEGFTDSYQANLEVNWAKTHKMSDFSANGKVYFAGFDVKNNVDELIKNEAVKLTTIGSNPKMESLVNRVYDKIIDLLYEQIPPEKVPTEKQDSVLGSISSTINQGLKEIEKKLPFAFGASFKRKNIKQEGFGKYDFSGRTNVERHHFATFNIADIYKKHGNNPLIFKDVALFDAAFQQRNLSISIDGEIERDFAKMINNITVFVKKTHQDSTITLKEITINKLSMNNNNPYTPIISYLNHADSNQEAWLEYEYQVVWQLMGGYKIITEWTKNNSQLINLYVPYKKWKINLDGDLEKYKSMNISAIMVRIDYVFAGKKATESKKIIPTDNLESKFFEITVPNNFEELDYTITWLKKDGTSQNFSGKDKYGIILIDKNLN
jgi:hypothetical protein